MGKLWFCNNFLKYSISIFSIALLVNCKLVVYEQDGLNSGKKSSKISASPADNSGGGSQSQSQLRANAAEAVFKKNCLSCHGTDPVGNSLSFPNVNDGLHAWETTEPPLINAQDLRASNILDSIHSQRMPPNRALAPAAKNAIIDWVENLEVSDSPALPSTPLPIPTPTPTPTPSPTPTVNLDNQLPTVTPDSSRVTRNKIERFYDASLVVKENCMSCHGINGTALRFPNGAEFKNEVAWKNLMSSNTALIIAGDSAGSNFIKKLRAPSDVANFSAQSSSIIRTLAGNMPPTPVAALTTAQIAAIADWIDLMEQPTTQLLRLAAGQDANAWNTPQTAIKGLVGEKIRIRNLDPGDNHTIHADGVPFQHGVQNPSGVVGFGGVNEHTFNSSVNNTGGTPNLYDHFKGVNSAAKVYFNITNP